MNHVNQTNFITVMNIGAEHITYHVTIWTMKKNNWLRVEHEKPNVIRDYFSILIELRVKLFKTQFIILNVVKQ